jgi:hypothetical protein
VHRLVRLVIPVALAACSRDPAPTQTTVGRAADARAPAAAPAGDGCAVEVGSAVRPAAKRLVAVGDVHGDLAATRAVLRLAGAIDDADAWIGGDLAVVQLGDVLDRGDDEQAIVDLFEALERQAAAAGGSFTWLLGNHELMNAAGDYRYVTPGGWRDFDDREAVMAPGGTYARVFAGQDVIAVVGDSVFSHAGVLPTWTSDLTAANRAARCWLDGAGREPEVSTDPDGPVWTRAWGGDEVDCGRLREVLGALGVERMVVAHTPQLGGITSACDGRLWRIDTGMSAYYGGPIQALEITAAGVKVLAAP